MYRILLGIPCSGTVAWTASQAAWLSSRHHRVNVVPSSISGPNFNACLVGALNACEAGQYDLHAQMHADFAVIDKDETCRDCHGECCFECGYSGKQVYDRCLDILVEEMDKTKCDFISVPMAIKDPRHVTSSGIGNPDDRWHPWRRFTTKELLTMPKTFTAEDIGYGDKFLLHNNALCIFDMRSPVWRQTDETGCIRAMFNFEERISRDPKSGKWIRSQESEDWAFSRRLWELGAKTCITSRIVTDHHGGISYTNDSDCGTYQDGDEDTAGQWRPEIHARKVRMGV
jgi:hypothetical protein